MRTIIKTIPYKDKLINVYVDVYSNPRTDFDNLGIFYSIYPKLNPDNHEIRELISCCGVKSTEGDIPWDKIKKKFALAKVWYCNSDKGMTVRVSNNNPFPSDSDSGLGGVLAVSNEKIKDRFKKKRLTQSIKERAFHYLVSEASDIDAFLCKEIYGYVITEKNGDTVDDCWGFYCENGSFDGKSILVSMAKSVIDDTLLSTFVEI